MSLTVRDDPRLAGEVIRYHTWPHIRQQSVGEHSWQVSRIIMTIAPQIYWAVLLPYAVKHDMAEIVTGDLPYPIKANNSVLSSEMDKIEVDAINVMDYKWNSPSLFKLTPQEKWVFKLAEFIEMWEWGLEESLRGNQFARKVIDACYDEICYRVGDSKDETVSTLAREYVERRYKEWVL